MRFCRTGFAVGVFLFTATSSLAAPTETQDATPDTSNVSHVAALPADIPALPGPRDLTTKFLVNSKNAQTFQEILLAPLAAWLREGRTVIRVVRNLDFSWKLSPEWETASTEKESRADLDQFLNLKINSGKPPVLGYPFGTVDAVDQEKDLKSKAVKILWNVQYAISASRDAFYDGEFAWLGSQSVYRRASAAYYRRFFPGAVPEAFSGNDDVMFQEVLQLTAPPVVFGYANVDWRYRGLREDDFWMHSPVIGRNRKLPASNRQDPIIAGSLSVDDLFGWSGKVQSYSARVVDEKVVLLPFPSLNTYRIDYEKVYPLGTPTSASPVGVSQAVDAGAEGSPMSANGTDSGQDVPTVRGHHKRLDTSSVMALWNHETGEYSQVASWTPTTVSFVPRNVYILELLPKDPFGQNGKEILVVDKESFLPFYRIVFGQGGDYIKTVVAGWCLASAETSTEKTSERFPFLGFLLGVESDGSKAMSFTTQFVRSLPSGDSKLSEQYRRHLYIQNYKEEAKSAKSEPPKEPVDDEAGDTDVKPPKIPAASPETKDAASRPIAPAVTPDDQNVDSESAAPTHEPTSEPGKQSVHAPTNASPSEDPGF